MRKQKGFSLIELLIVVAIILIIAAIAIPNLLRAKISANQSSAAAGTRTLTTAEIQYNSNFPSVGYAPVLADLGPGAGCPTPPTSAAACLIDLSLATADVTAKSGYLYKETGSAPSGTVNVSFSEGAIPANPNRTGVNSYCSFEDAVVRYDTAGADNRLTCTTLVSPLNN